MSEQDKTGFQGNLVNAGAVVRIGRFELVLAFLLMARLVLATIAPVTDTTEARYADMARMMVETGDWITPQIDYGVPFWGKPPLHTWLSAAGIKVFGPLLSFLHAPEPVALAARLPILGTALVLLWVLYRWIALLRDRETALVAAIVLTSSALFFGASAFVMTDMPLALGVVLAMVGFHRGVGIADNVPDRRWGLVFFGGLAVGLLAKGPVAVVLAGIPLFLWLLIGNRWRLLRRLPWFAGTVLLGLTVLPWYVAAEIKTPGFLRYFFIGEHFERFTVPNWQGDLCGSGHERAKGMIWLYGLGAFLPWLLFVPILLWRVRRGVERGLYSYLALFTIAPLILFTPAANILAAYVLPGMPAAAALLVVAWRDLNAPEGRVMSAVALVAATVLPVCALGMFMTHDLKTYPFRTTEGAVRLLSGVVPDARVWTLGDRVYSAEFYTRGGAQAITPEELPSLLNDDHRDAIIVSDPKGSSVLPEGFQDLGRWTIYRLWVEPPLAR